MPYSCGSKQSSIDIHDCEATAYFNKDSVIDKMNSGKRIFQSKVIFSSVKKIPIYFIFDVQ